MIRRRCHYSGPAVAMAASLALLVPCGAAAQTIGYEQPGDSTAQAEPATPTKSGKHSGRGKDNGRIAVQPYIEAAQIVDAELSPGNEVLTYTQLAAGVDAGISGRRNALSASVRYERRIGWGKDAADGDAISGVARGYATVVPGVTIEAGALATQVNVEDGGSALSGGA